MGLVQIVFWLLVFFVLVEYVAWRIGEHVKSTIEVRLVDEDDWQPDDGEPHPEEEDLVDAKPTHIRLVA